MKPVIARFASETPMLATDGSRHHWGYPHAMDSAMPARDRERPSVLLGRRPVRTLVRVVILLGIGGMLCWTARDIVTPVRILGQSMEPTFRSGQVRWVNRLAYRGSAPMRGELVAIQGNDRRFLYLKRVIALPGEWFAMTNGSVVINGVPLAEAYVTQPGDWNVPPIRLRATQYLVIGDNRAMPQALHLFGAVERSRIVGRVRGGGRERIYPPAPGPE